MTCLYNEIESFAAAWLRNLIAAGHVSAGDVDERSIAELRPADVLGRRRFHAFAGIGLWDYALRLAGWPDDVPVWTGSCPCQPFSHAGKRQGGADPRHLWPEWFRLIRECRPQYVFGEQTEGAIGHGWLDLVSADLEAEGYAVGACVLGAHSVGAPHRRQRLYFVAMGNGNESRWSLGTRITGDDGAAVESPPREATIQAGAIGALDDAAGSRHEPEGCGEPSEPQGGECLLGLGCAVGGVADTEVRASRPRDDIRAGQPDLGDGSPWRDAVWLPCRDGKARLVPPEPALFPLVDGYPGSRVGVLRAAGNAIVPQTAAAFVRAFLDVAEGRVKAA